MRCGRAPRPTGSSSSSSPSSPSSTSALSFGHWWQEQGENMDCLDNLVRRIQSFQSSIDDDSDDEDFNVTHSEFRQTIMNDQNRTIEDLNTQMQGIKSAIDDIEANLASTIAGQCCQVQ